MFRNVKRRKEIPGKLEEVLGCGFFEKMPRDVKGRHKGCLETSRDGKGLEETQKT